MTSGRTSTKLARVALLVLWSGLAHAAAFDLATLMQSLAASRPGEVSYVERKYSQLLTAPLEARGTLRYTPPNRLEKVTQAPRAERTVVEGERLTVVTGERTRSMMLGDYPGMRAFIESIRSTLAGDRATLERYYRLRLEGESSRWWLTLEPLDPDMRTLVQSIRIAGTGASVREVEVFEAGGDRSVMTIGPSARTP